MVPIPVIRVRDVDEINHTYFDIIDFCNSIREHFQMQIFLTLITNMFIIIYMTLTAFNDFVSKSVISDAIIYCQVDSLMRVIQTVHIMSTAATTNLEVRKIIHAFVNNYNLIVHFPNSVSKNGRLRTTTYDRDDA